LLKSLVTFCASRLLLAMPLSQALALYTCADRDGGDGSDWDANEVAPGLWVGGLSAAENAEQLESHGVAAVVTVAARLKPQIPESVRHTAVSVDDHPCADILKVLPAALEAVDAVLSHSAAEEGVGRSVLVHCASGVSRSVATCVAWLMTRRGLSLEDALRQVREGRPNGNPNWGFLQALALLEKCKGNFAEAQAQWAALNKDDMQTRVRTLRQAANELHARADALEERIAQHRSEASDGGSQTWKASEDVVAELETLLSDVDSAAPQTELDDRPARMIRQAAAKKVTRLLALGCSEETMEGCK